MRNITKKLKTFKEARNKKRLRELVDFKRALEKESSGLAERACVD